MTIAHTDCRAARGRKTSGEGGSLSGDDSTDTGVTPQPPVGVPDKQTKPYGNC